jgi:hypothetical protein
VILFIENLLVLRAVERISPKKAPHLEDTLHVGRVVPEAPEVLALVIACMIEVLAAKVVARVVHQGAADIGGAGRRVLKLQELATRAVNHHLNSKSMSLHPKLSTELLVRLKSFQSLHPTDLTMFQRRLSLGHLDIPGFNNYRNSKRHSQPLSFPRRPCRDLALCTPRRP